MAASMDFDNCLQNYVYLFNPDLLRYFHAAKFKMSHEQISRAKQESKVAFVTGGGSGIGFTITEILMRHGCDTVIASRNLQRVEHAAAKLQKATGKKCLALQMDVRKPETILKAFDDALGMFKRIDILVNNAAGNFLSPAASLSFNAFRTVMDIDTIGTFNCSKVVYEKYFKNHGGVIVNISANLPYRGTALQTHAGSAKAAIDAMTKHLAVEWGPQKIRVVGLAPGPIADTEGMRRLGGSRAKDGTLETTIPLERMGTRLEMAHAALFLASEAASYITGTVIVADGGAWLTAINGAHRMSIMKEAKL